MQSEIRVNNSAEGLTIDIEGVIGVPEECQFDDPSQKVATYAKFSSAVKSIAESGAKNITINIRSAGGSVRDALLIYDTVTSLNADVATHCYGYVASAATIIAQAASAGKRRISNNALYLIHNSSVSAEGNAIEIEGAADLLRKTDERIANLYAAASGRSVEDFATLMSENNGHGKWLSPQEAVHAGLVDEITNEAQISNMSVADIRAYGLPDIPKDKQTPINQNNMKIQNTWNAILDFFGFDKDKENELTEAQLEKINNELNSKHQAITNLTNEIETLSTKVTDFESVVTSKDSEIKTLNAKVSELEAENAKLKATPTATESKEDPSHSVTKKDPRNEAYQKDLESLK